jgi:oxalate decarboxylase/phosphoglucose isomerase-like protein (cupin superfamily)
MQRFVAGQTSLHKGKHYHKRADTQVCPYTDGHTDMAVAKSAIRNVAVHIGQRVWCNVGALPATPCVL